MKIKLTTIIIKLIVILSQNSFSMEVKVKKTFLQSVLALPEELQLKITQTLEDIIEQPLQLCAKKFPKNTPLPKKIYYLTLSPQLDQMVCCMRDIPDKQYIADLKTGKFQENMITDPGIVRTIVANGKKIIATHNYGSRKVKLYRKQQYAPYKNYCTISLPNQPNKLKFNQNEDLLQIICGSQAHIYNTEGACRAILCHSPALCKEVTINSDNTLAATSLLNKNITEVYIWILPDKSGTIRRPIISFKCNSQAIQELSFSQNNQYLIGKALTKKIHTWNLNTNKHKEYEGAAISPCMNLIIRNKKTSGIYTLKKNILLQKLPKNSLFAKFNLDGSLIVTYDAQNNISLDLVNKIYLIKWLLAQKNLYFNYLIARLLILAQENKQNLISENSVLHKILMNISLPEARNFLIHCLNVEIIKTQPKKPKAAKKMQKTQQNEQCLIS